MQKYLYTVAFFMSRESQRTHHKLGGIIEKYLIVENNCRPERACSA